MLASSGRSLDAKRHSQGKSILYSLAFTLAGSAFAFSAELMNTILIDVVPVSQLPVWTAFSDSLQLPGFPCQIGSAEAPSLCELSNYWVVLRQPVWDHSHY